MKIILTGATGMVGEGVLLECLQNDTVTSVLLIGRKTVGMEHPKLKELLLSDFNEIESYKEQLGGYDACFYCAGISSVGMNEQEYTRITYDTTLKFARVLCEVNPSMIFIYVSGAGTDSSEKGKLMWARVKGKTENDLIALGFRQVYNFRPGIMKPAPGQKNAKNLLRFVGWTSALLAPKYTLELLEVGKAMIHGVEKTYPSSVCEIADIKKMAKGNW